MYRRVGRMGVSKTGLQRSPGQIATLLNSNDYINLQIDHNSSFAMVNGSDICTLPKMGSFGA